VAAGLLGVYELAVAGAIIGGAKADKSLGKSPDPVMDLHPWGLSTADDDAGFDRSRAR
jgi:hypothetical protein